MHYQFFAVPANDPAASSLELNQFCAKHRVVSLDKQFVVNGDASYWAFCITWVNSTAKTEPSSPRKTAVDYKEVLSVSDFALFSKLRELRKELASRDAVPVYNVFTNEQLATMVQLPVRSKADFQSISGVGKTRLDKYAEPFLQALSSLLNATT